MKGPTTTSTTPPTGPLGPVDVDDVRSMLEELRTSLRPQTRPTLTVIQGGAA